MDIHISKECNIKNKVIFVYQDEKIDYAIEHVSQQVKFNGKLATILPILKEDGVQLFVGLGKKQDLDFTSIQKSISALYKQIKAFEMENVSLVLSNIELENIRYFSQLLNNADYFHDALKSEKRTFKLKQVNFVSGHDIKDQLELGYSISKGQSLAKDLKNLPPNIATTQYLFDQAKALCATDEKFSFDYLDEMKMKSLGMGCITAVGQGSIYPTYIACMEYNGGNKDEKPYVLIGKGLAFDSGGLCLKPAKGMDTMKMDMGGAASVIATMQTVRDLELPINVVGVIALVENAIDANSYRPGDVLTSMAGITVEVGNTDAEGRLALCDALTYVEKYNPASVIDIATLTGAIIIALGGDLNAIFANNEILAQDLIDAGNNSKDLSWNMPLHTPYMEQLHSSVADTNNIGGSAGSITAALFLSKFAKKYKWAHLDVAGTAMGGSFEKATATGRPVPLLTQYLINQSNK